MNMLRRFGAKLNGFRIAHKFIVLLIVASLVGAGVYGSITVLTQTFGPVGHLTPILTSSCTSLTPTPADVATGSGGTILFDCSGNPALIVSNTGPATPNFALPSPYTQVNLVSFPTSPFGSQPCGGGTTLASGTPAAGLFTAGMQINYCVSYSNAPSTGLPSFSVSWSQ